MEVAMASVISPRGVILAEYNALGRDGLTRDEREALQELKRRILPAVRVGTCQPLVANPLFNEGGETREVVLDPPVPLQYGRFKAWRAAGSGGVFFAVVTAHTARTTAVRAFLRSAMEEFDGTCSWSTRSPPLSCQVEFRPVLCRLAMAMHPGGRPRAAGGGGAELPVSRGVEEVRAQKDEVQAAMVKSVNAVIDRGERLDLLQEKSDRLETLSKGFRKGTKKVKQFHLRNKMRWGAVAGTCATAAVGIPLLVVLV